MNLFAYNELNHIRGTNGAFINKLSCPKEYHLYETIKNGNPTIDTAIRFKISVRTAYRILDKFPKITKIHRSPNLLVSDAPNRFPKQLIFAKLKLTTPKIPKPIEQWETLFDFIDNEEKAYWLGFLYADSYVCPKNSCITLSLAAKDKNQILKFSKFVSKPIKNRTQKIHEKTYPQFAVCFTSRHMSDKLSSFGIVPRRNVILKLEIIPSYLLCHFVRGIFDGDGSISSNAQKAWIGQFNICGNEEILAWIQERIGLTKTKLQQGIGVKYLKYKGINNLRIIYNFLYNNATIYLDRKKNVFENVFFNHFKKMENNKISRSKKILFFQKRTNLIIAKF